MSRGTGMDNTSRSGAEKETCNNNKRRNFVFGKKGLYCPISRKNGMSIFFIRSKYIVSKGIMILVFDRNNGIRFFCVFTDHAFVFGPLIPFCCIQTDLRHSKRE